MGILGEVLQGEVPGRKKPQAFKRSRPPKYVPTDPEGAVLPWAGVWKDRAPAEEFGRMLAGMPPLYKGRATYYDTGRPLQRKLSGFYDEGPRAYKVTGMLGPRGRPPVVEWPDANAQLSIASNARFDGRAVRLEPTPAEAEVLAEAKERRERELARRSGQLRTLKARKQLVSGGFAAVSERAAREGRQCERCGRRKSKFSASCAQCWLEVHGEQE